ncbi:Carboxylesterase NlhH [Vibrio aerogenes CECT 7868]|uniref:Carboxylesterase NlhH n=1 Tax=Vibrio aerogenes CECT 7868 TaxID=1216006 RepID=A0A1M5V0Q8_9VIBR|nr:alpha/beta hydrolase [Vibrio aerogenes]SHH68523.1 Carboxylesterase NlhH [Vibrio aerogenes CECT 7868]
MYEQIEPGIRELVQEFIASGKPCSSKQTIQQRREGYVASTSLAGQSPDMAEEFICELNGIQLKVFKPVVRHDLPVIVYFHGGCFVSGGFETHTPQLRQLAQLSECMVICIRYRLAPEHVYPAAHDDVYQAVLGIQDSAVRLGVDSQRMFFIGDSAGAQLALVTSLRLKQRQQGLPSGQILIYPMLDPFGSSHSYQMNGQDYMITAQALLSGFAMYTANQTVESVCSNPELHPLQAADLSGLPQTWIITAEFDPLKDEGFTLYERLRTQGVTVQHKHYAGVIHGFFQLAGVSQSAVSCIHYIAQAVKEAF